MDGAMSLLHLGLTLGGSRVLRVGAFEAEDSEGNVWDDNGYYVKSRESNVWREDLWNHDDLFDTELVFGSTYLSSPFVFQHGVKHRKCDREDPVITLQCRLAC